MAAAHLLLAQMEPLPLVAMAAQAQHQASAARLLPMQAVVAAALMLEARAARVVLAAAERVLIQVLLGLTELQILAVAAAQDRNIAAA